MAWLVARPRLFSRWFRSLQLQRQEGQAIPGKTGCQALLVIRG
jgi:hypothetical protein